MNFVQIGVLGANATVVPRFAEAVLFQCYELWTFRMVDDNLASM